MTIDQEAEKLHSMFLKSDEGLSIDEFYDRHASDAFKKNAERLHRRREDLLKKGIIEG